MRISMKKVQSQTSLDFVEREKSGIKFKTVFQWMMAAILTCGAMVLTSCINEGNPVNPVVGDEGIAMIVKNGDIDYFRQIETAFRDICQEKGLKAFYYSTSSETAYQEQLAAVADLSKLDDNALRGIIISPCFGPNGESAEAAVAALAEERGIPVVIIDSPVSTTSPLASCPYFGTDNTAAGKAMAEKVMAEKVAVFAMTNSPGIERAEAFKKMKPNAVVYEVSDKATNEVQAVLNEYNDFVFFNGNDLVDALPMLKAAGKSIYTFDVYGEFLDELIAGSTFLKGIMAQNTFEMARKAVKAVLTNAKQGEMVPTFYITEDNLDDESVKPFLEFYDKQAPVVISNLAMKIRGKWIVSEIDGKPALSSEKTVTTFVSPTKALYSSSKSDYTETQTKWSNHREYSVKITGNKVTLTGHPEGNPDITLQEEYIISDVTPTEIVGKFRHTTIREGQTKGTAHEQQIRLEKTDIDYRHDVIGTWVGTASEGKNVRWEIKPDGTYVYSRMDGFGKWVPVDDIFNEYFVDGYLFCVRWKNADDGKGEQRQWWEIQSIQNGVMKWKSMQKKGRGVIYTETVEMKKVRF
jgi:ABC-type sugar transport system substrate-binding protein